MFCQDYIKSRNSDNTKKSIDTLRPEFIIGTNAVLSKHGSELILKWVDHYPEKKHLVIQNLFNKLNERSKNGLPFLGGFKLKYEIGPPRSKKMRNKLKRQFVDF